MHRRAGRPVWTDTSSRTGTRTRRSRLRAGEAVRDSSLNSFRRLDEVVVLTRLQVSSDPVRICWLLRRILASVPLPGSMFASDSVRFPVADHSSAAVLVGNAGSGLGNAGSGRNRIPLASRSIRLRPLFGHGRVSAVPGARSQQDRPAARLREEAEHRRILVDTLDLDRGGLHPLEQVRQILGVAELDADERGTGLTVGAFDVLEHRDVVLGAEDLVEEAAQGTGLLREVDDEVVLEAFVDQGAFEDLRVAGDVVVASRDEADDGGTGFDGDRLARFRTADAGRGQGPGGFGDDAVDLVHVEHLRGHRALGDGTDVEAEFG